ncbi:serine/threonine protein kinase [Mucilaginibacter litoreus]|uniref:Serine/threonine protein kinase n=1 Tax=Mucilaginibacter litoreus TaxID=1048221 RepID=A0ABW3AN94_9SPHI
MSKVFTITEGLENLGALRTGGQGSVYKGRRMGPMLTAVKLLPTPIYAESEEDKNYLNFRNEVVKLRKVNEEPNPNVVKILSSGITESGSLPYIEMEYIDGPDLCDLLQQPNDKVFTLKEVIRLAYQLAGALAHCHKVGVKHGDIKSNNVKYNAGTGNYILIDFGLAVLTDEERRTSIRHAGAIEFMAPEQHDGLMLPQSDVYSYGIILYEMLTGNVPFPLTGNGETARNNVRLAHIESPVPDLRIARANAMPANWNNEKREQEMQVPHWLLAVINKCLQKRPENRYPSGVELYEDIVSNSFAADTKVNNAALLAENERLQTLVDKLEKSEAEKNKELTAFQNLTQQTAAYYDPQKGMYVRPKSLMLISRGTFTTVVIAALVFMALFSYSFFCKKSAPESIVPVYVKPADFMKPPFMGRAYNYDSVIKAQQAAILKKKAALKPKKAATVAPAKGKQEEKAKKKKRKKFLGIF